jgi:hypothetical protein
MINLASVLAARGGAPTLVRLPRSGIEVSIGTFVRDEVRAAAPVPRCPTCWAPNKPALAFEGTTTWAEHVIVRLLERAGWDGRWVRNWTGGRQLCVDVDLQRALPPGPAEAFERIHDRAPELRGAGTWDVFAWSGDDYLFLGSKEHRSSDRLNANQVAWLEAALDAGFSADQFAIVEYDAGEPDRTTTSRAPRAARAPREPGERPARARASAGPPAELVELLDRVRAIDRSERIGSRDAVAAFGLAGIAPMVEWLADDELRRFAIAVLEVIGRTDRKAIAALRAYAETGSPDAALAEGAADRAKVATPGRRVVP